MPGEQPVIAPCEKTGIVSGQKTGIVSGEAKGVVPEPPFFDAFSPEASIANRTISPRCIQLPSAFWSQEFMGKRKRRASSAIPQGNPARARSATSLLAVDSVQFWNSLVKAAEAEPVDIAKIQGASSLDHAILAAGFDASRRRLIVVSDEPDAQSVAVAQADIQAKYPDVRVIAVRPLGININSFAQSIAAVLGHAWIGPDDWGFFQHGADGEFSPEAKAVLTDAFGKARAAGLIPMRAITQIIQGIQQFAEFEWRSQRGDVGIINAIQSWQQGGLPVLSLDRIVSSDPMQLDRELGVCGFPLYRLSEIEIETIARGEDLDAARQILRSHNILQYFFPPVDQLALALVDRGTNSPTELLSALTKAPDLGHPLASSELTSGDPAVGDLLDVLRDKRYLCDGEIGLEVGPAGRTVRASLRFQPREGFVSKLLKQISITIDPLKAILGMSRGPG